MLLKWQMCHQTCLVDDMQYRCALRSFTKFAGDPTSFSTLCDKCCTQDCDNPIEFVSISIVGKTSKHKVYRTATGIHQVVQCDGFSVDGDSEDNEEDE
jgi:hypothetical protein